MEKMIMTPGPTFIHEDVRNAMGRGITNPDLDFEFYEFYRELGDKLKRVINTKNNIIIMSGEGILGLEAACASLIQQGDRVLCIENGIFGEGFGEFSEMYGAEVEFFHGDRRRGIDYEELKEFLQKDNDFKIATLVHCETPSGITNNIEGICRLLKSFGIITVVDAVASIGGQEVQVDTWGIDLILGASQKCFSASPGLTFISVSEDAYNIMRNRREKIRGSYINLLRWDGWYEKKWFPYTPPISELYGFDEAVNRVLEDKEIYKRHEEISRACRKALINCGLELYPQEAYSNTVTTVLFPEGISGEDFFSIMRDEEGILLAGAFGFLKEKVFRIGHMGENCRVGRMVETLRGIDRTLRKMGYTLHGNIELEFLKKLR